MQNIDYIIFKEGGYSIYTFDAEDNRKQYERYTAMSEQEFINILLDKESIGILGHYISLTLSIKLQMYIGLEIYVMASDLASLSYRDDGLTHLLFHCMEAPETCEDYALRIQAQIKRYLKLTDEDIKAFEEIQKPFMQLHLENKL